MYRDPGFEQCAHLNLLFAGSVNGAITGCVWRRVSPILALREQPV